MSKTIEERMDDLERAFANQNVKLSTTSKDAFAMISAHNDLVREFKALQGAVDQLIIEDDQTADLFDPQQGDIFIGCVFSPEAPAVGFNERDALSIMGEDHESG